ncbi:MAG TPA: methyltransferase domain-containing protein [Solirubrobacteraceae bacterium]|nr:methyltransferase domain-containing protein [Solirubrobacteraceae bacterium]
MASRSFTHRGFGLAVRVPDRLAPALRAIARRSPPATTGGVQLRSAPAILARRRDPQRAAEFVTSYYVDGRGGELPDAAALAALPLEDQVAATRWYHTIELADGVVTPGAFDHRPLVPHYGIPESLAGRRCLDAACSNGFWAFEFERRGGTVVAVDIPSIADWDFPAGAPPLTTDRPDAMAAAAFSIAHRALGSRVELVRRNLYTMDPADLGTFDFVHMADVLLHLRNPLDALRRLRALTATGGTALIADVYDPALAGTVIRYVGAFENLIWTVPSLECLVQLVYDAGYANAEVVTTYALPGDAGWRGAIRAVA